MSLKKVLAGTLTIGTLLLGCNALREGQVPKHANIESKAPIHISIKKKNPVESKITLEQVLKSQSTNKEVAKYAQVMQEGDYMLPEDIFAAYAKTIDPLFVISVGMPLAGYFDTNRLDSAEKIESFKEELKGKYSKECIDYYSKALSQQGITIFRQDGVNNKNFVMAYIHERMHKLLSALPEGEKQILTDAYNQMKEENFGGVSRRKARILTNDWQEVYAYATWQSNLDQLIQEHQNAYRIFKKLDSGVKGYENETFDNC